jgi:hypothetical protein
MPPSLFARGMQNPIETEGAARPESGMPNSTLEALQFPAGSEPFFVLTTQNPIEMEGTPPCPSPQLTRVPAQSRGRYPAIEELAGRTRVPAPASIFLRIP